MTAIRARTVTRIKSVPAHVVALTSVASVAVVPTGLAMELPVWVIALAGLVPWLPLVAIETAWIRRHHGWLSVLYVVTVAQIGHVGEHLAQMVQIHALGWPPAHAHGIVGALDVEWVHFGWNTWILLTVLVVLPRIPRSGWLWMLAALAAWHEAEHVAVMLPYLATGQAGDAGLLARGGAIAGGLPIARPDFHFFYNVVETIALVGAFVYAATHSHDRLLATALPGLSSEKLLAATGRLRMLRLGGGDVVPVGRARGVYVVSRGEVALVRRDADGSEHELGRFPSGTTVEGIPGRHGGSCALRALGRAEVLTVDEPAGASVSAPSRGSVRAS